MQGRRPSQKVKVLKRGRPPTGGDIEPSRRPSQKVKVLKPDKVFGVGHRVGAYCRRPSQKVKVLKPPTPLNEGVPPFQSQTFSEGKGVETI